MIDTDFASRVAIRDETWAQMQADLVAAGIERRDIWGSRTPVDPTGRGFKAGLYLLPVQPGEPRGTFIVCAGGAFLYKSHKEALPVAEFFHARGMNAAILDYTVKGNTDADATETRLQAGEDALQAVRYLRVNAEKLGIRADKIAVGGFSAGGMTSQLAATRYDAGDPAAADPLLRVSSRPDAVLLLYGAFATTTGVGMLNYDIEAQNKLAQADPIRNIRCDCPPMFLFQTHEDDPRCALLFALELAHRGIPYEVHTFAEGIHGGALYDGRYETPDLPHTARWAELAGEWLEGLGF